MLAKTPKTRLLKWTPERVDLLKKMWADGDSCDIIAEELGGTTRNAVISKVHRLKLGEHETMRHRPLSGQRGQFSNPGAAIVERPPGDPLKRGKRGTRRRKVCRKKISTQAVTRLSVTRNRHGLTGVSMETVSMEVPVTPPDDLSIPVHQRKTILTISDGFCRWPVGDPGSPEFFFCGATVEKGKDHHGDPKLMPYCGAHCGIAYQASPHFAVRPDDRRRGNGHRFMPWVKV